MAYKQNLVERKFCYINTLDHEGPTLVGAMRNLAVGFFEYLEITSPMDVDKIAAYTQRILRVSVIRKYREVLVACRKLARELAGYEWNFRELTGIYAEALWTWAKTDTTEYDRYPFLPWDKCVDFDREIWFELGKCMWRNNRRVYQDHMEYICNDIVKPLKVKILRYTERVRDMHELAKYFSPPSIKGNIAEADNWNVRKH